MTVVKSFHERFDLIIIQLLFFSQLYDILDLDL